MEVIQTVFDLGMREVRESDRHGGVLLKGCERLCGHVERP